MNPIDTDAMFYGADEPVDVDGPAPVPEGVEDVAWMHRKAGAQQATIDMINKAFDAELARLQEARAQALGPHERTRDWWLGPCEAWHRRGIADSTLPATVKLPSGKLSHRKSGAPAVEVTDEQGLRDFLLFQEGGADLSAKVFKPNTGDKFMVSGLKDVADKFEVDSVEPGAVIPLKIDGEDVPGVRVTRKVANWKANFNG